MVCHFSALFLPYAEILVEIDRRLQKIYRERPRIARPPNRVVAEPVILEMNAPEPNLRTFLHVRKLVAGSLRLDQVNGKVSQRMSSFFMGVLF